MGDPDCEASAAKVCHIATNVAPASGMISVVDMVNCGKLITRAVQKAEPVPQVVKVSTHCRVSYLELQLLLQVASTCLLDRVTTKGVVHF